MALDFSKGTPLNQEDNISIIKPENNQVTTQNDVETKGLDFSKSKQIIFKGFFSSLFMVVLKFK